jgi:hypothetical protein
MGEQLNINGMEKTLLRQEGTIDETLIDRQVSACF